MGVNVSPDIFQEKMSNLMALLEFLFTYQDDLQTISNSTFEDHFCQLLALLGRLRRSGLKVNIEKSSLFVPEIEYLGYIMLTKDGIKPVQKKVQAVLNLQPVTILKQLRSFLDIVKFYRETWRRRSHILAPLTFLVGVGKIKFKQTEVHQKAFDDMKKVMAQGTIITYPNLNEVFKIHTDVSDRQLGAVISPNGRLLSFYSRKLSARITQHCVNPRGDQEHPDGSEDQSLHGS